MARIKQSTKHVSTNMVLEDPRPSSRAIYILGDAHDFSSLSPIFAKSLCTRVNGSQGDQAGDHRVQLANAAGGASGKAFFLTKGSTSVHQTSSTTDIYSSLDLVHTLSLDPAYTPTGCSLLTDGTTSGIFFYNSEHQRAFSGDEIIFTSVAASQELYDAVPDSQYNGTSDALTSLIPYIDPSSKFIPLITRTDATGDLPNFRPGRWGPWPNPSSRFTQATIALTNWWGQVLGIANDGSVLYFVGNLTNDNQQRIITHDLGTNVTTYLQQYSTVRPAFEGAAGGTRSAAAGSFLTQQIKLASSLFDDPNLPNTKGFYYPYFDINENFQPYYFQWNRETDEFTRNEDVSMLADSESTDFYASSANFGPLQAGRALASTGAAVFCETFTIAQGETVTRYLTLGAINGRFQIHDGLANARRFITFEVDSADPKKLTYHSDIVLPSTPRNFIWLNDSKTLLGVFFATSFRIYNFTPATGWVEGQVINEQFWSVGRDRTDRIWALASSSNSNYGDLHLVTPALPVTIRIIPENETYNYQGVTINTFVQVEAINVQGNRIETDVTLVIDGPTFAFTDGSKSQVVRTSSTGAVTVPIRITDSGFSQIIASVTI